MLTLQFVPYHEIENLNSEARIRKILNVVKSNKIVVVEGILTPEEEASLIERTMQEISRDFKGIEIGTITPNKNSFSFKKTLLNMLGYKTGMTVIGPASIVKEIKRDPSKIELFTKEKKSRK